ncbi:MAG: ABC-F family ATP-binding cassette domain-containing protein [Acidobacteriota bacterium]
MLIGLKDVAKSFGSVSVLVEASLQLNTGEKVGLVGRNGSGKTTLFRLIAGDTEPDAGLISRHPGLRIGWMQQLAPLEGECSLLDEALSVFASIRSMEEELERLESEIASQKDHAQSLLDRYSQLRTRWEAEQGYSCRARAESVLFGLGFDQHDLQKSATKLSGGELSRLGLAKLLLSDPNLLLLDEPTNHLDVAAIAWLENYLRNWSHAFIVISHDRYFLDGTTSRILEVSDGKVEAYPGNYSSFAREREKRRIARQKAFEEQQALVEKTQDFIRRNLAGQKTKQAQSRRKMLEKLVPLERAPSCLPTSRFGFRTDAHSGAVVLRTDGLEVGYPKRTLAANLTLTVCRGDKLAIIGPNGSGKTSLLRTLLGRLAPLSGEVELGQKVSIAFFDQQLTELGSGTTVIEEMRSIAPLETDQVLRGYLARFLFVGDEVFQPVKSLSGGERSRLALAKLVFSNANTLVLDEPTNHLDIPSCEALEAALQQFPGTLLFVSHDRYFVNRVATRILDLDGTGRCHQFDGTYEDYLASLQRSEACQLNTTKPSITSSKEIDEPAPSPTPQKLSKNEVARLRAQCENLEKEIHQVEAEIDEVVAQIGDPSIAADFVQVRELGLHHELLQTKLDGLYRAWERSLERLESEVNPVS